MSRSTTRRALIGGLLTSILVLGSSAPAWTATVYEYGYNKVTNTEIAQFTYYGTVQIRPSQMVNGKWTVAGFIRYFRTGGSDSGRIWTPSGTSRSDNRTLRASKTWFDSFNPNDPKTQFRYGFTYADPGQVLRSSNSVESDLAGRSVVEYSTYID